VKRLDIHRVLALIAFSILVAVLYRLVLNALSSGCTINGHIYNVCYYVDYATGSNTNDGLSKTTPFKTPIGAPGHDIAAPQGTAQILKGGVTWPMNAIGCWTWTGGQGTRSSSNPDYIGAGDQIWFTGVSWSRPILNGNGASVSPAGCPQVVNTVVAPDIYIFTSNSYLTIDNIEFTGALWGHTTVTCGLSCDGYVYLHTNNVTSVHVQNSYFHGASMGANTDCAIAGCNPGFAMYGGTQSPVDVVAENDVIDGSDGPEVLADPSCVGKCESELYGILGHWSYLKHDLARYVSEGFDGGFQYINGNTVEYVRASNNTSSGAHANGIQLDEAYLGCLIWNNLVRHTNPVNRVNLRGVQTLGITNKFGTVCYGWNGVIYDTTNNNQWNWAYASADHSARGTQIMFNWTIAGGPEGAPNTANSGANCVTYQWCTVDNIHYITNAATSIANCTASTHCTDGGHNLFKTLTVANRHGYSSTRTFAYSTTAGGASIGGGGSIVAWCSAIAAILAEAGADCLADTSYGVGYNSANHTVIVPGRTPNARNTSAPNHGAYEFLNAAGRQLF